MVERRGPRVDYGMFRDADADGMVRLLGEVFAHRDPPAVATGVTPAEFEAFVRLLCPSVAAEGLTVVARSVETGEACGVMLALDSASALPEALDELGPSFDPIFDILGQLDEDYWGGEPATPGESIHLFLLGVATQVAGQGCAQRLVADCLAHARGRGYRRAVTEATNPVSQHIFRKQGFVERVRRSYRDHRFNGEAVFASIADQGGPILMDRRLEPDVRAD